MPGSGTGTPALGYHIPIVAESTALDIITAALIEIGVLAQGETASASDSAFCLGKMNRMLGSWNTRRLYCYCIAHATYDIVTSKQSYTIGPSAADFIALRPIKILAANMIITSATPDSRFPLEVINVDDYNQISAPALSAPYPSTLYYQATYPNGTLWPHPYPTDTANSLELFAYTQLAQFINLTQRISLPAGYEDAIVYSLAEALCPSYGRPVTVELAMLARQARSNVQSLNVQTPKVVTDAPGMAGTDFDYLTGRIV